MKRQRPSLRKPTIPHSSANRSWRMTLSLNKLTVSPCKMIDSGEMLMWQYVAKVVVTALLVVAVTELGKRSSVWGAVFASLPLTSLMAFVWLYVDTGDRQAVAALSSSIFWLVLPSLPLFVLFPAMLRSGWSFWLSVIVACLVTITAYFGMISVLHRLNIKL